MKAVQLNFLKVTAVALLVAGCGGGGGTSDDGAGLVATRIERDDDQDEVELEGSVQNVAQPNFTVGGVAVTTDGNTEFRDTNGVTINAAAFFQAAPGRKVKARGSLAGNVVLATRAELED